VTCPGEFDGSTKTPLCEMPPEAHNRNGSVRQDCPKCRIAFAALIVNGVAPLMRDTVTRRLVTAEQAVEAIYKRHPDDPAMVLARRAVLEAS